MGLAVVALLVLSPIGRILRKFRPTSKKYIAAPNKNPLSRFWTMTPIGLGLASQSGVQRGRGGEKQSTGVQDIQGSKCPQNHLIDVQPAQLFQRKINFFLLVTSPGRQQYWPGWKTDP
jgi:hypothetical protein